MTEPRMVKVAMTFRDSNGQTWITAGEILDNLVRGDERMSPGRARHPVPQPNRLRRAMSKPDRACPDYPNECMHPWAHARTYAEVVATQMNGTEMTTASGTEIATVDLARALAGTFTPDELARLLDAFAEGKPLYITDVRVVVDDPTTPEEGPLEG